MVLFRNTSHLSMPIKLYFEVSIFIFTSLYPNKRALLSIIDLQLLGPGRNSKQPMLKAMNAFVSLHATDSCSPAQIVLPSSTRHGKSREQEEKGTLDGLLGHSDSTQACPRAARLGPTAASISVPALVDDDFVCYRECLAAARNKWQPVALGSLKCIGLCEVHPWAYVSVISLRSPVADTKPDNLKPPISSLYLALDAW